MSALLRRTFQLASSETLPGSPRARLIAMLFVIVVPGGLVLPLCYAAYAAVRRSLMR